MAEVEETEKEPEYAKAAACSGALLYRWDRVNNPFSMHVGVVLRDKSVGPGLGITGGGYAEIKKFLEVPIGTIQSMMVEAYRELEEELGAKTLHEAISQIVFERYAQPLGDFLIRTPDGNKVHAPAYLAFPYQPHERVALSNLEPTAERKEQIMWMTMSWRSHIADMTLMEALAHVTLSHFGERISPSLFFHAHEWMCVFVNLAQTAARGRLWNERA